MQPLFPFDDNKIAKFFRDIHAVTVLKKAFLILLICITQGYSQTGTAYRDWAVNNELKLNTFYLPGGYPEVSYERILGNKSAVGISMGFLIDSAGPNYATDILTFDKALVPYYRYYFGKRRAAGFFVEGNAILYSDTSGIINENETGWGMGLATGIKIFIKNNWNLDFVAGGGVNINKGNSNLDGYLDFPDLYPRLGLSIGKRF